MPSFFHNLFQIDWWDDNEHRIANAPEELVNKGTYYQKKKVVGLERGPLSLVSTTEELLDRKNSGSCLENREYGHRDPSR
jgi:hypothetical protein